MSISGVVACEVQSCVSSATLTLRSPRRSSGNVVHRGCRTSGLLRNAYSELLVVAGMSLHLLVCSDGTDALGLTRAGTSRTFAPTIYNKNRRRTA